jgi:hypothetical protein
MVVYAQRHLSIKEQLGLAGQGGTMPEDVAPFIVRLQIWPYTAGMAFVQSLVGDGGERAVDAAFRRLPMSTEQIMDPSSYPDDVPVAVDVPQLAPKLGPGWRDLDVEAVGAAWLSTLLGLRMDQTRASDAVAGWEGGVYRAWTDGSDVAVVLRTAWEDAAAASRFGDAVDDWLGGQNEPAELLPGTGNDVTILFASNEQTLDDLRPLV